MNELATLRAQVERMEREQAITRDQLEEVRTDMGVCKRAVANGIGTSAPTPRIEVPKPTTFDGKIEARVIDDLFGRSQDTSKLWGSKMTPQRFILPRCI